MKKGPHEDTKEERIINNFSLILSSNIILRKKKWVIGGGIFC